jgi:hypothetical protein
MKLGECLVFCLKYYPEMKKLYWEEEEDVPSLPEPHDTMEKASKVGRAAGEEATAFLEKCAALIVSHFAEIGNPKVAQWGAIEKKMEIEKRWSISVLVWPRGNIKCERMKVGVNFAGMDSGHPEIVPWIWRRDVKDQQHAFVAYLQAVGKAKGTWSDVGLVEGAIALGRIPIVLPPEGFEIEADSLLASVKEGIQKIDQGELVTWFPK